MYKFKNYPQKYEPYATREDKLRCYCVIDKVSAFNDVPGNTAIYLKMFRDTLKKFHEEIFNNMVKIEWLKRRFCYGGEHRVEDNQRGRMDAHYGIFVKYYVGAEMKKFYTSGEWANRLTKYFDDFFPNFNEGNPFVDNYRYPFEYMSIDCLLLVNRIPERMNLLKYGESQKMEYPQFVDYVINWYKCYNEEEGETYELLEPSWGRSFTEIVNYKKKVKRRMITMIPITNQR